MRFVHLYLLVYFALVIGAGLALWQAGILQHIAPLWIGLTSVVVLALGFLLVLTSAPRPAVTPE
jgi:hypothetical protein